MRSHNCSASRAGLGSVEIATSFLVRLQQWKTSILEQPRNFVYVVATYGHFCRWGRRARPAPCASVCLAFQRSWFILRKRLRDRIAVGVDTTQKLDLPLGCFQHSLAPLQMLNAFLVPFQRFG